jgi:hypothetical protein
VVSGAVCDGAAFATPEPIPRAASPSVPATAMPPAMVFKSIMIYLCATDANEYDPGPSSNPKPTLHNRSGTVSYSVDTAFRGQLTRDEGVPSFATEMLPKIATGTSIIWTTSASFGVIRTDDGF